MNPLLHNRHRDPLTLHLARSVRETEARPMDWWEGRSEPVCGLAVDDHARSVAEQRLERALDWFNDRVLLWWAVAAAIGFTAAMLRNAGWL
jgi:hypothetical protein